MRGAAAVLVLAVSFAVSGCGGSGSAATRAPTAAGATQGVDQANLGTANVTFGGTKYSYPIRTCGKSGSDTGVVAYTDSAEKNGLALAIFANGNAPALTGAINGETWVIIDGGKAQTDGKTGTFSGKDTKSGKDVSGDFACN